MNYLYIILMSKRITNQRSMIEIENSKVKCFLGNGDFLKSSEDLFHQYKTDIVTKEETSFILGKEKYIVINPIPEKKISIITKDGKTYKSTIYFIEDIKNIILGLNIINPVYYNEGQYKYFEDDDDYKIFLFSSKIDIIKDLKTKEIDFSALKKKYEEFKFNDSIKLKDINENISLYSKIDNIGEQNYFITGERIRQKSILNKFCKNEKREEIDDVIYGIFGNYACGKSIFLVYFNSIIELPSIYLNLKIMKNSCETDGFQEILNNELMILFHKLDKSYEEYKKFIEKYSKEEYGDLLLLIKSIIEELKTQKIIVIFDQYQEELFTDKTFITDLKNILFEKDSKIKIIISSSINDGQIRDAYLDLIFGKVNVKNEKTKEINKTNNYIPYHFMEKLVNEVEIKTFIKNNYPDNNDNKHNENKNGKDNNIISDNKNDNDINLNDDNNAIDDNNNNTNNDINNNVNVISNIFNENYKDNKNIILSDKDNKDINDKNDSNKSVNDKEKFNSTLKLFNFLPLYYNLCRQHKKNLDRFIESTKKRIEDKIIQFNDKAKSNLVYLDEIRKMIDNEESESKLKSYCKNIPFKYSYIEKSGEKYILRTHFPLIKEIWNNIIMSQTVNLFDGEIKYDGNVIGSLLELNLITNIKNGKIPLSIDKFCKVDMIYEFGNFIENNDNDFINKDIFITQKNQNAASFDIAYLKGRDFSCPKLAYVQVKKSLSNNMINMQQTEQIFQTKKDNFSKLFLLEPKEINLVYITLINNMIKKAIIEHDIYKRDKNKKVSDLGNDMNNLVYSINSLIKYCDSNYIQLYFYEPSTLSFYIKDHDNFIKTELDLFKRKEYKIPFIFDNSYLDQDFQNNQKKCAEINVLYNTFLSKKRKRGEKFSYKIGEFDFEVVFEFAKGYFKKTNIIGYIDLHKTHLDIQYYNSLPMKQAAIFLKVTSSKKYEVDSLICNNYFLKKDNNGLKLINNFKIGRENDFLVIIGFDSALSSLTSLFH